MDPRERYFYQLISLCVDTGFWPSALESGELSFMGRCELSEMGEPAGFLFDPQDGEAWRSLEEPEDLPETGWIWVPWPRSAHDRLRIRSLAAAV